MTTAPRPNIVLIHWHDLGTFLEPYGHPELTSPNLARFAADGIRFDAMYATAPFCSPARGSLFTGRYPHSNGLVGLTHRGFAYHEGERTLPMYLSDAGYQTVLVGLQHEARDPRAVGFSEVLQADGPQAGPVVAPMAVDWLERRPDGVDPFFMTVGFHEVHRPFGPELYEPADPQEMVVPPHLPDSPETREDLAEYAGSIRLADSCVGLILDALDRTGLDARTLVIFTTDHGQPFPRAKGTLYSPGIHVAFLARPPRDWHVETSTAGQLLSAVDVVPTLLELAGVAVPEAVQGRSFADILRGHADIPGRRSVFAEKDYHGAYDPMRSIRTADWSYIRSYEDRALLELPTDIEASLTRSAMGDSHHALRPREELYDLHQDPVETRNLIDDPAYAAVAKRLSEELDAFLASTDDPILRGPTPAPPHAIIDRPTEPVPA